MEVIITPAEVEGKAEELRKLAGQLKSAREEFDTQENALSEQWEGDAKEAYRENFKAGMVKLDAYAETVEKYASALDEVAGRMRLADAAAAKIAQR